MMVGERLHGHLPAEQRPAGDHLVEHPGERVQVRRREQSGAHDLLGRHVARCAQDGTRRRLRTIEDLGNPEVGDLEQPVTGEHDVVWVDVPVQDTVAVRVGQRRRGGDADRAGRLRGQRAGGDPLLERAAREQFHDE